MAAAVCVPVASTVAEVMRGADTGAERDAMPAADMVFGGQAFMVGVIIAEEWAWA
jgi:hypothetical protein